MKQNLYTILMFGGALLVVLAIGLGLQANGTGSLGGVFAVSGLMIAFFGIYFVVERSLTRSDLQKRFDKMQRNGKSIKGKETEKEREAAELRRQIASFYDNRQTTIDRMGAVVQRLFKIEGTRLSDLKIHLSSAGLYGNRSLMMYLVATAASPILGLVLGGITAQYSDVSQDMFLVYMAAGALLGFLLVRMYISRRIKHRKKAVYRDFPDAIDLLVIYAESGMTSDIALQRIVVSMRRRYPICAEEIHMLERELQVLPERSKAYENFSSRVPIPIVLNFCGIMLQSERMGSSIVDSLRSLSVEMRRERLMDAKRRAAKIPILMQVPTVFFILPALFLTVMGSTVVTMMQAFSGGGN